MATRINLERVPSLGITGSTLHYPRVTRMDPNQRLAIPPLYLLWLRALILCLSTEMRIAMLPIQVNALLQGMSSVAPSVEHTGMRIIGGRDWDPPVHLVVSP